MIHLFLIELVQIRINNMSPSGTPPRLERDSIDFTNLPRVDGDNPPIPFSFMNDTVWIKVREKTVILLVIQCPLSIKSFLASDNFTARKSVTMFLFVDK